MKNLLYAIVSIFSYDGYIICIRNCFWPRKVYCSAFYSSNCVVFIVFLSNGSMASMKREQLRASPCFTPFPRLYPFPIFPFIILSFLKSLYKSLNIGTKLCSPVFCRSAFIY